MVERKRRLGQIITTLLLIALFAGVCNLNIVFAKDTGDYKTFSQNDPRWQYKQAGTAQRGLYIGAAGCWITSHAALMAYDNPKLRDVNKFNPHILSTSGATDESGAWINSDKALKKFTPEFTLIEYANVSGDAAVKKIKEALKNDFYVCMYGSPTNSTAGIHMVAVLGTDGDGIKYLEVGDGSIQGAESFKKIWGNGRRISLVIIYKGKNKSSVMLKGGGESANSKDNRKASTLINEESLAGMPKRQEIADGAVTFDLPDSEGLSTAQKHNVDAIKENMQADSWNWKKAGGTFVSMLGFLCMGYGFLLLFALLFDKSADFLGISVLSVISLGRLKIVDEADSDGNIGRKGFLTQKQVIFRIVSLIVIGMLLVGGTVLFWLQDVYLWVNNGINGVGR